jgi:3-deoxy-D-manno-octulosonate 8-phosphate phosphatase KdsC-like HAD superfamily phosphatase
VDEAKAVAHLVSTRPGGKGCARECIEMVMKLHGEWELDVCDYKQKF